MPAPQRSDDVIGLAPPVHVYPVASPGQPVTDGSVAHAGAAEAAPQQ